MNTHCISDAIGITSKTGIAAVSRRPTSLQELMELGGWKSYEMVLRYAHLAPDQL